MKTAGGPARRARSRVVARRRSSGRGQPRRGDGRRLQLVGRLEGQRPAEIAPTVVSTAVGRAFALLTAEEQDVLAMRFWDELPVPEIAAVLGCTPNAASIRIHRAKQRLAGQLVGSAGNEDEEVAR